MRTLSFSVLLLAVVAMASSCNQFPGCTEPTADNFDPAAKTDDGTCIPARDKMIGNYTFTRTWTDVITTLDSLDLGSMQVTEANTASNDFVMNLNGTVPLHGSITASDISIVTFSMADTFMGFSFTRTYTGSGSWLESDTVDMRVNLTTQIPIVDGNPPALTTVPQTYSYFCTKLN